MNILSTLKGLNIYRNCCGGFKFAKHLQSQTTSSIRPVSCHTIVAAKKARRALIFVAPGETRGTRDIYSFNPERVEHIPEWLRVVSNLQNTYNLRLPAALGPLGAIQS